MKPLACPACKAVVFWRDLTEHNYLCPTCRCRLRVRRRYLVVLQIVSYVIVGLFAYAVGVRDDMLILSILVGGLLGTFVLTAITAQLFPPELEVTGHFRGVLYGDPSGRHDDSPTDVDHEPRG